MHDFLPENFSKVGVAYNLLEQISTPFFSQNIPPHCKPISHADIVFRHLNFSAYSLI